MIDQAFIDAFKPERISDYVRQHARSKTTPATQTPVPKLARRSPLPSAREIDTALHVKYGAARYGKTGDVAGSSREAAQITPLTLSTGSPPPRRFLTSGFAVPTT
jgi:hypothetical protein